METLVMFGDTYAGRRVFVTGHTGFKGSWLSYWLAELGADVTGYALEPPTEPSLFDALRMEGLVRHNVADVRDAERLRNELHAARPEVVFHLAAQPIVRESYVQPRATFDTNVMGTVNVLEAIRACDFVAATVVVTSDKCYRNHDDGRPFVEDDAMGGRDPYSASKGCAELVAAAYSASFFGAGATALATARAGNVIGGGDWAPDRIVPDCVRALTAGRPIEVRNPHAVRPWQHVLEPLAGYLLLGAALVDDARAFEGAWNFGPAAEEGALTVRWVVDHFITEWGSGEWVSPEAGVPQPHEAHALSLDSSKATAKLGWTPVWDSAEAVRRTATWYRRHHEDPAATRAATQDDLKAFTGGAERAWAGRHGQQVTR